MFDDCSVNAVRGGEVKRVLSLGRGTKVVGPSSMTQLALLLAEIALKSIMVAQEYGLYGHLGFRAGGIWSCVL